MDNLTQLGEKKISSLLLKFSVPAIIGMLVNSLYNMVDRIFVGNSAGTLGIAGITISFPIQLTVIAFILLIGVGANALVSIRLGEGNKEEAEKIFGNAFTMIILMSLMVTLFGLIFLEPILKIFGASNEVMPYAKDYLRIILFGTVFLSLGFGLNNFIRGEGNPKLAMNTMLAGAIINALLCPIFIYGFKMGVKGSALATVIAQGVSGMWVLYYFLSGKSSLKIHIKYLILDFTIIKNILSLGFGQFVMELATSFVSLILNRSLVHYGGDMAISGMGIVTSIQTIVLTTLFAINQGLQPIIGYNFGAKNTERVKEALKLALTAGTVICIIGFAVIEIFPAQLVSLFNKNDKELIEFTVSSMKVFLLMLPVLGVQVIGSNYFMAIGKPKPAAFLSLSRQFIIFIPAILIFPVFFGISGIIMAGPFADFLSFIFTGIWLIKETRVLNKTEMLDKLSVGTGIQEIS